MTTKTVPYDVSEQLRTPEASDGTSFNNTGPREWQAKIGKIPVAVG